MSTQHKLGRIVNHDERSKNFAFNTSDIKITNITHQRIAPVLDQGDKGSCTGNAGIGAINTEPCVMSSTPVFTPDESGALKLYSEAEILDGGAGYPPEDVGSSGLSIAKVLLKNKVISTYQHTFTLNDALKALMQYPIITGINWYSDMFNPDPDGRVHITGSLEGGHEVEAFKVDADLGRIWFYNSWGENWGVNGTFYMTWADYHTLLSRNGDVTVLIPPIDTPPSPTPAPKQNKVVITRQTDNGTETLGKLVATYSDGTIFTCDTLELPWRNNSKDVSCIPKGTYAVMVKAFHTGTRYQLNSVPGRTGIFIHEGNYYKDSLGCILLGVKPSDINKDGQMDATSSVNTVAKFMSFMKDEPFTLQIV